MNVHEFAELAAGYALDALSPEDAVAFEDARAEHPEWDSIVWTDAASVAALADAVVEVEPPAHVRAALLARIAAPATAEPDPVLPVDATVEAAPSTEAIQTVARRNWTRGLLALAASFILLIALGTTAVVIGERLRAPASVVALNEIQAAPDAQTATVDIEDGGTATAHWSESVGKAVLVTDGLPQTATDETYQLWFVRDDGAVSAGLFETDDVGTATALLDGTVEDGDVIAVTIEPEGGSPTGQPTSDPLFTIPTA